MKLKRNSHRAGGNASVLSPSFFSKVRSHWRKNALSITLLDYSDKSGSVRTENSLVETQEIIWPRWKQFQRNGREAEARLQWVTKWEILDRYFWRSLVLKGRGWGGFRVKYYYMGSRENFFKTEEIWARLFPEEKRNQ